jgi:hypothetical protein
MFVNRSAVIVRIKQPFADWANQLPDRAPDEPMYTAAFFKNDGPVLLIPDFEDTEDLWDFIDDRKKLLIFEEMLEGWSLDENLWPQNRTAEMFDEWFELDIREEVIDTLAEPLTKEDIG